jgi:two-component system, chemotaxis family, protein-glutamate methylesterase/glutaminase
MRKIRVLIVDDAVVVRRIVSDVLSGDPALEVAGTAANGHIALAKIEQLKPDIVTMDMEMPEMDGVQTLKAIRKTYPQLPVIMFSTLTERGGLATLEALSLGASDYVTKPANVGSVSLAIQRVQEELIPKIKALCPHIGTSTIPTPVRPSIHRAVNSSNGKYESPSIPGSRVQPVEILAIGISTGGPNALAELVAALPADFPVPILIVQHMPPLFTRLLAERLGAKSSLKIAECIAGEAIEPGQVWIAPGGSHMTVEREGLKVRLRTNQDPPENSCRPAVDVLFRSVAQVYGAGVLAAVLTGMGQDGLRGCEMIHDVRGQILVQDESTSVVWGMPGAVAHAGLAQKVLPLDQLAPEILRRVNAGRPSRSSRPAAVLR